MPEAKTAITGADFEPIRLVDYCGNMALYRGDEYFTHVIVDGDTEDVVCISRGWARVCWYVKGAKRDLWFELPGDFPTPDRYRELCEPTQDTTSPQLSMF